MAYRNLIIGSPAQLSLRGGQLIIRTEAEHSVPIEDISSILLENRMSTVTTAVLSELGRNGCSVYFCDEKHLPCAVLTAYQQHSRQLVVLRSQLDATEPMKKRLWQGIVQEKIRNQAECLRLADYEDKAVPLEAMAERVRSGDPDNLEATAAQYYFPALFSESFTRRYENGINAALNYGYAILRGCAARALAVYGFQPAFGLHHRSTLNAFNLADDLMEPFRPTVDLLVFRTVEDEDELTPRLKQALFNVLNLDILISGQHHSVSYAMELLVQGLARALDKRDPKLPLPRLLELGQHGYE